MSRFSWTTLEGYRRFGHLGGRFGAFASIDITAKVYHKEQKAAGRSGWLAVDMAVDLQAIDTVVDSLAVDVMDSLAQISNLYIWWGKAQAVNRPSAQSE